MEIIQKEVVKNIKTYRVTLELTDDELRYVLHRLNLGEMKFQEVYKNNEYEKLAELIPYSDIWEDFNDILDGEIDD